MKANCTTCDKEFERPHWQLKRPRFVYCSHRCQPSPTTGRRTGIESRCFFCNKPLYVYPSGAKSGNKGKYCRPCYLKNVAGRYSKGRRTSEEIKAKQRRIALLRPKGPDSPRWKGPLEKTCEQCKQVYLIQGRGAYGKRQRFCSTECWYEYVREDPERHPTWKGGYEPYYGANWRKQSRLARARDGHRCQRCGKTPRKQSLEVHHIQPFREFTSWRKANTLSNLITLCKSCHARDGSPFFFFAQQLPI